MCSNVFRGSGDKGVDMLREAIIQPPISEHSNNNFPYYKEGCDVALLYSSAMVSF